jgi:hypothetical protein
MSALWVHNLRRASRGLLHEKADLMLGARTHLYSRMRPITDPIFFSLQEITLERSN